MTVFEAYHVYSVDPHTNTLDWREGAGVDPVDRSQHTHDYNFPFWVTGLHRHDLAVFGAVLDNKGVEEFGYLVTRTGNQAQLATPKMIDSDNSLLTAELAKRIATVTAEEIAQLGIEQIIKLAQQRYPGMRGLSR